MEIKGYCLYLLEDGSIECRSCEGEENLISLAPEGLEPGIYQAGDPQLEVEKGPEA